MRLIDADALLERQDVYYDRCECLVLRYAIEKAPTIEAVPVVRCKDCERGIKRTDIVRCYWHGVCMPLNGFCNYGRKRETA